MWCFVIGARGGKDRAMKKVRIGVIGCGVMGSRHVQSATEVELTEPVAVADTIEARAKELAARFNVGHVYTSADDLLCDESVDAVILAMPTMARGELALKALARGKHLLLEKPVAASAADVRKMIKAKGRLVAGCLSCRQRFYPHAQAAAAFVASGALGKFRLLRARSLWPADKKPATARPEWRLKKSLNGGGYLVNWGCYDMDYLLGLTGWTLRPRTVLAQTWPVSAAYESHVAPGSDAETYYAALVRCEDGTVISMERGEYMPTALDEAWQIIGERGSLRLKLTPGKGKKVLHDEANTETGVVTKTLWEGDEEWGTARNEPLRDFAGAILERRAPATDLKRALVVQQITDAIYASAARGKAVRIR